MSGATVVATGTGAEGFSSREVRVGAGTLTRCGWFRYFPLGVVSEVVFIIGKGDGGDFKASWSRRESQQGGPEILVKILS